MALPDSKKPTSVMVPLTLVMLRTSGSVNWLFGSTGYEMGLIEVIRVVLVFAGDGSVGLANSTAAADCPLLGCWSVCGP